MANDNFFDDLPVSSRRDKAEDDAGPEQDGMDDFVLPPSPEALNVDELLAGLTPPADQTESAQVSVDPPKLSDPSPQPDVLDMDLIDFQSEPAVASQATISPVLEPVRDIDSLDAGLAMPDADPLSQGLASAAAVSSAAEERQAKPETFLQKHKAKIVLVVLLAVVAGWNYHKKQKEAELAASQAAVNQPIAPYEAAIQQMQEGDQNVSHLDQGAALPFDVPASTAQVPAPTADPFGGAEDPFGEASMPEAAPVAVEAPQQAQVEQQAAAVPDVEAPQQVSPVADPAPVNTTLPDLQPVVDDLKAKVTSLEKERDEWKARALKAEEGGKPVQSTQAPKQAAPRREPVKTQQAKVVSSRSTAQAVQPKATVSSKPEVQWLGSFMVGNAWHAHAIIAGSVYELSPGQRIAGLRVDNVTATGVKVNGHEFR